MRALCWAGVNELQVEDVGEPRILNSHDAIVKVSLSAACGSDLYLLGGYIPSMRAGDVLGHEFIGEIVEVGSGVVNHRVGDRVVVCSFISCGHCHYCKNQLYSLCDNGNPNPGITDSMWGAAPGGCYGYSYAMGGWAGSHAEYIRVPYADQGGFAVPDGVSDTRALFASDAAPTGWMGARSGRCEPRRCCRGVEGRRCRPDGCASCDAARRGAGRRHRPVRGTAAAGGRPHWSRNPRLPQPGRAARAEGDDGWPWARRLHRGCRDGGPQHRPCLPVRPVKQQLRLQTDRPTAVREAIQACRKGGSVYVLGVFGALVDKFPLGALMNRGVTLRAAQQHGQRYIPMLLERMAAGELRTEHLATHVMSLEDSPHGYQMFKEKTDGCVRAVFRP